MLDESRFVAAATFAEDLKERVPAFGFLKQARGDAQIKLGQVVAVEVPDKIGRT